VRVSARKSCRVPAWEAGSGFGHVAMPELMSGNAIGTARCIRPGGCRDKEPYGLNSQKAKQVQKPEHERMVAAPRIPPAQSCIAGIDSRADFVDPKERPMSSGKKRTRALLDRGGVRTQATVQGSQR